MADIEYLTVDHLSTKDLARIFSKICVDPTINHNGTPCWIWIAGVQGEYGSIRAPAPDSRYEKSHRLLFAWLVHPLPRVRNPQLDHLCQRKLCCNPVHLEFVTARVNTLRSNNAAAINARKTRCKRGHEFSRVRIVNGKSERYCKECARLQNRKQYHANPEYHKRLTADWRRRNPEKVKAVEQRRQEKRKLAKALQRRAS